MVVSQQTYRMTGFKLLRRTETLSSSLIDHIRSRFWFNGYRVPFAIKPSTALAGT